LSEFITEEVVLLLVNQFDGLTGMVLLLDTDLSIHLESWRFSDHVIPIVKTIMANVVANSSCEDGKDIKVVELGLFSNSLGLEHVVAMLGDIRGMEIIVILD